MDFSTILSYGSYGVIAILLVDKIINGITKNRNDSNLIRKEIGDTYKERADQLEEMMAELTKKCEAQTVELASLRGEMTAKDKHIETLNATILNRNPELERILGSINEFLRELTRETKGQTAMLKSSKEREDKIDKATEQEEGHILRKK